MLSLCFICHVLWWPWEMSSRPNWPRKISIGHISATVRDTDLWLKDDASLCFICHVLWWPGEIRSRSIWTSKFPIGHISVTIKYTDLWLILMRDDMTGHRLPYLWWPWKIRSMSNQPLKFTINLSFTTIADDVILHHLYLWWPWDVRSWSNWPSKCLIGHTSVIVKDTDMCLITRRDGVLQ